MEFSERITAIYDAAFAMDRWQSALDAIQHGTQTAGMMFYDISRSRPIEYNATGISSSYAWITPHVEKYNELASDPERGTGLDEEGSRFMHRQPAFKARRDDALWSIDANFLARPEIQFTKDHMKMFRRFFVNVSEEPTSFAALLAHYSNDHVGPPQKGDMEHVELFAPHFSKALELNRTMYALRQRHNAALAALDMVNVPICIVQESGHVVLSNRSADTLLRAHDGMWLNKKGKLSCGLSTDTGMLENAVARIAQTAAGRNAERALHLKVAKASGSEPMLVVVSPLRDADMELEPGLNGALCTILDGSISNQIDPSLVRKAFVLTEAEARVLPFVLDGKTNREIATAFDVSPETVKSHVSSILSKTRCKNRLALLWRLFQWSPPIQ